MALLNRYLLLIEAADTTAEKDRSLNKAAYASAGIAEYWIVNIPARQLEQYLEPRDEDYQLVHTCKSGQWIESKFAGSIRIEDILP